MTLSKRVCAAVFGLTFWACGVVPSTGDRVNLTVTWALKEPNGSAATCPANTSVKVVAQAYRSFDSSGGVTTGSPFVAVFDCSAGTGSISLIRKGNEPKTCDVNTQDCDRFPADNVNGEYDVNVFTTDKTGKTTLVASLPQHLDVSGGPKSAAFELYPNGGYLGVGWRFIAMSNGAALYCDTGGVDTVKVRAQRTFALDGTPDTTSAPVVLSSPCLGQPSVTCFGCAGATITTPLPAGDYNVTLEAYAGSTLVGTSASTSDTFHLGDRGLSDRGELNTLAVTASNAYTVTLTGR